MTTKSESMLIKVRGLLAKAADPNIDPREADLFRAKADELMVKYAIEQWQVSAAYNERDITSRHYDFSWYTSNEQNSALWMIMLSTARHCRVKVVNWEANFAAGTIPVVGLTSDMDWFDLLFTNIMVDFTAGLEPRPNRSRSFEENVAVLKESGMKWLRIAELLFEAEMLDATKYGHPSTSPPPTQKQVHNMGLATVYTKFCDRTDRKRERTSPSVYRRSFALGYSSRLSDRLREMRKRTMAGQGEGSGMELVLADIYSRAEAKARELFGQPPSYRGGGKAVGSLKYSHGAMNDGARRADNVDISAAKGKINSGKGSLNA